MLIIEVKKYNPVNCRPDSNVDSLNNDRNTNQMWVNYTWKISIKLQLLLQSVNYSWNYMLNHGGQLQLQLVLNRLGVLET